MEKTHIDSWVVWELWFWREHFLRWRKWKHVIELSVWKNFNLKWNKGYEIKNFTHALSEEWNLKTEKLISHKCSIYRQPRLISWPMNILQDISPHPQVNELTTRTLADPPLLCTPCPWIKSTQTIKGLACKLIKHAFPKLQFLCYSQINSISGNLSSSQFTFLFRLISEKEKIMKKKMLWWTWG